MIPVFLKVLDTNQKLKFKISILEIVNMIIEEYTLSIGKLLFKSFIDLKNISNPKITFEFGFKKSEIFFTNVHQISN